MFKDLGYPKYKKIEKKFKIRETEILDGLNKFNDFFIYKLDKNISIYNRVCDHAGGKLISKDNKIVCPNHYWVFNPAKGKYENDIKKKKIDYNKIDGNISFKIEKKIPNILKIKKEISAEISIRFFNHAFMLIKTKNFKFATDPWAIGPAFNNGWWLKNRTKKDWLEELNSCDFIFISHNHPDHLHPFTLKKIRKNIEIIVPNFKSDSTGLILKDLGFNNIRRLDFAKQYQFNNTNLVLSILKSGDFREDSGVYFSIGNFTALFDVDANSINYLNIPKTTLYASAFGGGSSGYPLMFNNYNLKEQIKISKKDKNLTKLKNQKNLSIIKPKFFIPYASFFIEKAKRDNRVFRYNQKNEIKDYNSICNKYKVKLLNVENFDEYIFKNEKLISSKKIKKKYFKDLDVREYILRTKKNFYFIDKNYIKKYFINSNYLDNLKLFVSLTNDNFKIQKFNFEVDFSHSLIRYKEINSKINFDIGKNLESPFKKQLYLKIRKESFLYTIYNKLPWDDILIGFQAQVYRNPNIYNANFWHHFCNFYVSKKYVRSETKCNACKVFSHFVDNDIYKNQLQI
tara:strand:+ start:2795 stop:4504 length:1710 start_codon:yes stop_codon:yes gene_type:complete